MAEHHYLLGTFAEKDGEYARAQGQYDRALAFSPGSKKIMKALLRLYQGPLKIPERAEQIERLMEHDIE